MGNFGLNAGVPWLRGTPGALCLICKEGLDDVNNFLWECKAFRENFQSVWSNLFKKIDSANPTDGLQISCFIRGFKPSFCLAVFLSCLISTLKYWSRSFCAQRTAVGKIYRVRKMMLSEMGAPWLKS